MTFRYKVFLLILCADGRDEILWVSSLTIPWKQPRRVMPLPRQSCHRSPRWSTAQPSELKAPTSLDSCLAFSRQETGFLHTWFSQISNHKPMAFPKKTRKRCRKSSPGILLHRHGLEKTLWTKWPIASISIDKEPFGIFCLCSIEEYVRSRQGMNCFCALRQSFLWEKSSPIATRRCKSQWSRLTRILQEFYSVAPSYAESGGTDKPVVQRHMMCSSSCSHHATREENISAPTEISLGCWSFTNFCSLALV